MSENQIDDKTRAELEEIAARYPEARSGLLPMLHLVQSAQGRITPDAASMGLAFATAFIAKPPAESDPPAFP